MKREEHKGIVNQLLGMVASEHQARASELLTNLGDDYEQVLTASEQASANVETLTKNNETLREVNAKLFLRVGESDKEARKQDTNTGDKEEQDEEQTVIPFSKLFNEKGELL